MKPFFAALFIAAIVFAARADSILAHAKLDHCTPAPGTVVTTAPREVRCWFTEEIDDKQSTLVVNDSTGAQVDDKDGHVDLDDPEHKQMFATVNTLPSGVYKVTWHTVTTDDQGASDGTWYFGVGPVTVPTYAAPTEHAASAAQTTPMIASTPLPAVAQPTSQPATATLAPTASVAFTVVAPTVSNTPTTPPPPADSSLVVAAGVLEIIAIVGILAYLYRQNR